MTEVAVSADAVRAYIRTLRKERRQTQGAVADAINMAVRTYKAWETGETIEIKTSNLLRAVRFLRGSYDQVAGLADDATAADGAALALEWVSRESVVQALTPHADASPADLQRLNRLLSLLSTGMDAQEAARRVLHEE